jgi:hypothetical protein
MPEELREIMRTRMICWFSLAEIARAGLEAALSQLLAGRADQRRIQAIATIEDFYDLRTNQDGTPRRELWIDYVADLGDGFNSTYAIAYLLGRALHAMPDGRVSLAPHPDARALPRGDLLIMGGDEAYPMGTDAIYERRTVRPYEAASPGVPGEPGPDLFAIPGNHDWYDGLDSFMDVFLRGQRLGAWQTRQTRSYFAIALPHGYWLCGVDLAVDTSVDPPQLEYFARIAREHMRPGDRVILCSPIPAWVSETNRGPARPHKLVALEQAILSENPGVSVVLRLAGDLHHYRRHASVEGVQNIIAGGGGAFLFPTHEGFLTRYRRARRQKKGLPDASRGLTPSPAAAMGHPSYEPHKERTRIHYGPPGAERDYLLQTSFPTATESRRLAWGNLAFLRHNMPFAPVPSLVHGLLSLALLGPSTVTVLVLLVLVVPFIAATDAPNIQGKVLGGLSHAAAHVAWVALLVGLLARPLGFTLFAGDATMSATLFVTMLALAAGAIVGSTLVGVYLLVALNVFGRHANEAFAALRIEDYKNFLRIRVDETGLTIHPIGLRRVPRHYCIEQPDAPGEAWIVPKEGEIGPHLIEDPVRVPR